MAQYGATMPCVCFEPEVFDRITSISEDTKTQAFERRHAKLKVLSQRAAKRAVSLAGKALARAPRYGPSLDLWEAEISLKDHISAGIAVAGEVIKQTPGGNMAKRKCEVKETLEVNARKAVAYEKGLETTLPDPEAREDALQDVELASLNLRNHVANCSVCRQHS